jgi:hypothetical protein
MISVRLNLSAFAIRSACAFSATLYLFRYERSLSTVRITRKSITNEPAPHIMSNTACSSSLAEPGQMSVRKNDIILGKVSKELITWVNEKLNGKNTRKALKNAKRTNAKVLYFVR